jgi:hypothetical protein
MGGIQNCTPVESKLLPHLGRVQQETPVRPCFLKDDRVGSGPRCRQSQGAHLSTVLEAVERGLFRHCPPSKPQVAGKKHTANDHVMSKVRRI